MGEMGGGGGGGGGREGAGCSADGRQKKKPHF